MKLLHGNRELIDLLEEAAKAARAGEIEAVVLVTFSADGTEWEGAHRDDMPFAWSRMVAGVTSAHHDLVADGLPE